MSISDIEKSKIDVAAYVKGKNIKEIIEQALNSGYDKEICHKASTELALFQATIGINSGKFEIYEKELATLRAENEWLKAEIEKSDANFSNALSEYSEETRKTLDSLMNEAGVEKEYVNNGIRTIITGYGRLGRLIKEIIYLRTENEQLRKADNEYIALRAEVEKLKSDLSLCLREVEARTDESEELIDEVERLKGELFRVVTVLCETRKHNGKRPCNFCRDMHLHLIADSPEEKK